MVPVGEDQAPIIEQTNKLVRRLNGQIGHALLPKARALIPAMGRLPGIDGKAKMSKSQGNAIPLSASDAEIEAAVQHMYTDPNHLRATDPGQVKGNVVSPRCLRRRRGSGSRVESALSPWRVGGHGAEALADCHSSNDRRADPGTPGRTERQARHDNGYSAHWREKGRQVTERTNAEITGAWGYSSYSSCACQVYRNRRQTVRKLVGAPHLTFFLVETDQRALQSGFASVPALR